MPNSPAFALGTFVGNPNGSDANANASFEASFDAFVAAMGGARPQFMNAFTDFTQDPSQWDGNAGWTAWSWGLTGSSYVGSGAGVVPVIGVPLSSNAGGWSNVDTFFKAIIAGTYDSVYAGIVNAWAGQGYKTLQARIGYEFNGQFMPWAPDNSAQPTVTADFIAAWQRVASVLHAAGAADGVTVQTVWNPALLNYDRTSPTALYPGDAAVDIVSADVYSPAYPNDLTDWSTGGVSSSANLAAWAAIAANQEHAWLYEDGTKAQPTGNGLGWSMADTLNFAIAHNKPLSISETGAGGDNAGKGPADNPAFPLWLAGVLAEARAAGITIGNVDIWATDQSDGSWGFLNGEKPLEAASWKQYFGAGSNASASTPTISVSSPGMVQPISPGGGATVSLKIVTSNLITDLYAEVLTAAGTIETGYQRVGLAADGTARVSMYLAQTGDVVQVTDNPNHPTTITDSASVTIVGSAPPVTIGSGASTLALLVSEDAWNGNAQFTIAIDGVQIGGTQTAQASRAAGAAQTFAVKGNFAAGSHTVTVNYLNDAYGGSPTADRNLFVVGATINGSIVSGATLKEYTKGPKSFSFVAPSAANTVSVDPHAPLASGVQAITGTETDPTQPVFLDWHQFGVPALGASDWVRAVVSPSGRFAAAVAIDHPGTVGTLFYHAGAGPVTAAWSATPV